MSRGGESFDARTGLGYGAMILRDSGACSVVGVDIDESSIERARQTYRLDGLELIIDDCEGLPNIHSEFDIICNFEDIEHLRNPGRFLAAAARLLSPDGSMFCSTPCRETSQWVDGKPINPFHITEWYRDEFHQLLSPYFENVELLVQIELQASVLRKEAVSNLNRHLFYLWSPPWLRVARMIGRIVGRAPRMVSDRKSRSLLTVGLLHRLAPSRTYFGESRLSFRYL